MQNKPKFTITKEYVGQQLKIKYEGVGGGVILFNEINEYRDYGNGYWS